MKSLWKILRFTSNLWPYYLIVTVASVLMALANQAPPFVIKLATDAIVHATSGTAD